ncbi:MAG: head GIN domain-containing protein [Sediminicola sp.]|tara:strand:- start:80617 stop:81291 length:675 start_codon:yes stop_codon:yes gene_type:complete
MKNFTVFCVLLIGGGLFAQRTIDKEVGSFNEVKIFDLIEVNLIHSDENRVFIKGENVDDILVINKNGTLKIRMQLDKKFRGEDTVVEIHYRNLDIIDGNEGAKITCNELVERNTIELRVQEGAAIKVGLNVDHLKLRAVTGGIVEASGIAKNQEIVLNTGGIFEGRQLRTETSDIKITAAGEAELYASEKVNINVRAGGDVTVYGNPKQVNKNTFAGGRVRILD